MSNSSFRGFSDFASASAASSTTAAATIAAVRAAKRRQNQQGKGGKVEKSGNGNPFIESSKPLSIRRNKSSLQPSPIFTGSDTRLILLFRKIGQKRDPATKTRALEELTQDVFSQVGSEDALSANSKKTKNENKGHHYLRPEKIAALCHLVFLHETKLGYDNSPAVRAGSYKALTAAKAHVPKAWVSLFLGEENQNGVGNLEIVGAAAFTVGMAWGASRGDPTADVSRCASLFVKELEDSQLNTSSAPSVKRSFSSIQLAVFHYSNIILGCKRASSLNEAINPTAESSLSSTSNTIGGGKGKKNKPSSAKSVASAGATTFSETEREEMEERYERVVLCTLSGLGYVLEGHVNSTEQNLASNFRNANVHPFPNLSSLTRLMQSSRSTFRRESFVLVGKICQFIPYLVMLHSTNGDYSDQEPFLDLGPLIPTLLSSERDPSNFVPLLEMILSYLAAFRAYHTDAAESNIGIVAKNEQNFDNGPWNHMDPLIFTKALCKVLRLACWGAPAELWSPMILPIVASLPRLECNVSSAKVDEGEESEATNDMSLKKEHPLPLLVVEHMWEGRKSAVGVTNTSPVVSAVTECATFLMLRRSKDSLPIFSTQSWMNVGELFLGSLTFYLIESPDVGIGPVAAAVDGLCKTLAKDLQSLDDASTNEGDSDRGISQIKSWMWGADGIQQVLLSKPDNKWPVKKLKSLLSLISWTQQQRPSKMIPALKELFHSIVEESHVRINKTCSSEEGELILKIILCCRMENIFNNGDSESEHDTLTVAIERFCVNDLLRWILVHATVSPSSTQTDFKILHVSLKSLKSPNRQQQIWEIVLRELIKSYCDFTTLAIGLTSMRENVCRDEGSAPTPKSFDIVPCKVLDAFAIETSNILMASFRRSHYFLHHDDEDVQDYSLNRKGNVLLFLKTCVGLSISSSAGFVSSCVVRHWLELCCERDKDNIYLEEENDVSSNTLLETLLLLANSPIESKLSAEDVLSLVVESWYEGERTWKECAIKLFDKFGTTCVNDRDAEPSLMNRFISIASSVLSNDIRRVTPLDDSVLELACQDWSKRAARLLDITQTCTLSDIGIGSITLWDSTESGKDTEFLFLCLMYLLHKVDSTERRRELLFQKSECELLVRIQSSVSEVDIGSTKPFQSRTIRNHQLIEVLESNGLTELQRENCCIHAVDLLASRMQDKSSSSVVAMRRALTSLSFFVSMLFPTPAYGIYNKNHSSIDDIKPTEVNEGDVLWYEKGENHRVKATVVKVHTDDIPNLYFTIKEDNSSGERQTVASRLKRNESTPTPKFDINESSRERIGRHMTDKLVKPFISKLHFHDDLIDKNEVSAECINIILSQIGLVSVGIGSVRYDIFQVVSSIEQLINDSLLPSECDALESISPLRCLSISMGYGICTPLSLGNALTLKTNPCGSIDQLLKIYEDTSWRANEKKNPSKNFHLSVAMWVTVAASAVEDGDTFRSLSDMTNFIATVLDLSKNSSSSFSYSLHIMNALNSIQVASKPCIDYNSIDSQDEKSVLSILTQCFANLSLESKSSVAIEESHWIETFTTLVCQSCCISNEMIVPAAKSWANELLDCLFSPAKRWCAFQLLQGLAKNSQSLQPEKYPVVPTKVQERLTVWKDGMDEEECDELDADVCAAASWLPDRLMSLLLENENKSSQEEVDVDKVFGSLLAWLICLNILDIAGTADMRNRSSISSFVQKTLSVGPILYSALAEAVLDISRNEDIFSCIGVNRKVDFTLQRVSTLTIFRTVESLPTLVKMWFNDDCPRYLQTRLSSFVENRVAPETLQRELDRIKEASSFGDMTVSGSCVSREVVATYQQDECQLSVLIRIPPTFPLRNVEVDCQKTLGIAENRWRRWALQIMLMLNNQDGSVLDALLLWKQNVDKEFDGVEPCPVCYSVLCIKTHAMPNLECKTCNNRFHTTCLYKWFQSSGKSQCVLCQQPWSGNKV